jgi:hypothetical protein
MDVRTPEYFRSGAASSVPDGSVLVVYPLPGPFSAETMVWQARDDFRYRMVGGYQNLPDGRGGFSHVGNLSTTRSYLDDLFFGRTPPSMTRELRHAIIDDLDDWDAATVVVDMSAQGSSDAVALFTDLLGRAPEYRQAVAVWSDLSFGRDP